MNQRQAAKGSDDTINLLGVLEGETASNGEFQTKKGIIEHVRDMMLNFISDKPISLFGSGFINTVNETST